MGRKVKPPLLFIATEVWVQPGGAAPIPLGGAHGFGVAIDQADGASAGMTQVRAAPVWIAARGDAADTWGVELRIVDDPAAGFVDGFRRYAL